MHEIDEGNTQAQHSSDGDMMDTSGSDMLPQKRADIQSESTKTVKSKTTNSTTRNIDWKQRTLG